MADDGSPAAPKEIDLDQLTPLSSRTLQCVKCEKQSTIAGSEGKHVAYCDGCYKEMLMHKFRSALGKRRVFKDGAPKEAVVVVNGSPSSVFLLGQMHEALALDPHKRLVMQPTVVTVVSVLSMEVLSSVRNSDRPAVHVAAVLRPPHVNLLSSGQEDESEIDRLSAVLKSCISPTTRVELMRVLKERLVLRLAEELHLRIVLVADTADDLARLSLSSLCIGRGAQIAEMTAGVEKRKGMATIVRPLKEVRSKEVTIGNRLFGWERDVIYAEDNDIREGQSVQQATNDFVEILQAEGFAATVSTVLSTSSKVRLDVAPTSPPCTFCRRAFRRDLIGLCPPCESIIAEVSDVSSISHLFQC